MSSIDKTQERLEFKDCKDAQNWLFDLLNSMKYKREVWSDYVTKEDNDHGLLRIKIYTDRFAYEISVGFLNKNYLSCKAIARRQRPGETFFRMNELFTGEICEDSYYRIINDIVSNELIGIYRRPGEQSIQLADKQEVTE